RPLMEPVEEGGTGEPDSHRRPEIAPGPELRGVDQARECRAGPAIGHTVALRGNLHDDAGVDGGGAGRGQLDVPVSVGLLQPYAPHPADEHEHAGHSGPARSAHVSARTATW